LSNQQHTDELLAKSRALKERSKATNENLHTLKQNADKMKHEDIPSKSLKKE
jgi:hypothetical protein